MIEEVRYDLDFDTHTISTQLKFLRDLGSFHSEAVNFEELGSIHLKDGGEKDSLDLKIAIPTSVRSRNWPAQVFRIADLNLKAPKALKDVSLKSWRVTNAQGELHYLYSESSRLVVGMLWQDDVFNLVPKNVWGLQTMASAGNPKTITAYLFGPSNTQRGGLLILSDFGESAFDVRPRIGLLEMQKNSNLEYLSIPKRFLYKTREAFLNLPRP